MEKVKHHTFAHLVLFVIIGVLAIIIFGGITQGPLTSFLFLGIQAYGLFQTASGGNFNAVQPMANDLLSLVIIFVINLFIFYILSSIIIFIFNLFFGEKKK